MYNSYLIEFYADTNPKKALDIAVLEVNNRATPEAYSFLAYAQLKSGGKNKALEIITTYVEGKVFEPMSLYYSALIYKENKMGDKVELLKSELQKALFEMGPLYASRISDL